MRIASRSDSLNETCRDPEDRNDSMVAGVGRKKLAWM